MNIVLDRELFKTIKTIKNNKHPQETNLQKFKRLHQLLNQVKYLQNKSKLL